MDQNLVFISSYEDLLARQNYNHSLSFHPKVTRRFGTVVAPYRFLEKIPCGIDSCHTPHYSGYLITTSDGLETGIGSRCGQIHFGTTFTRERKRVDQAIARRRRIDSVMAVIGEMQSLLEVIQALEKDYQDLKEKKVRLIEVIGTDVFSVLKARADRDSAQLTKEVPMTKAEAEVLFETSNRTANDGKGWPTKTVLIDTLEGLLFIKSRFKEMLVSNLIVPIRNLSKTRATDVEAMKSRELAATAKWVGEVPQGILKAQAVVEAGKRFFTADNVEKLVHLGANRRAMSVMIEDLRAEERATSPL